MEVKKISDKFKFYQEGASYIVDFGAVKRFEDKSVTLEVTGVEESGLVGLTPTCGCTTSEKTLVDKNTVRFTLKYNECDNTFAKTNVLKYNGKRITTIIIKGQCQ